MKPQDMKNIIHHMTLKNSNWNIDGTSDMLNRLKYAHTTTRMVNESTIVQQAFDDITLKTSEFMALVEKRRGTSITTVIDTAANNNIDLLAGIFGFVHQGNDEFKQVRPLYS